MKNLFKKTRFFLRLFSAFINKHKKLIIFGFLVGSVFYSFFPVFKTFFWEKNVQKIGIVGKYTLEELPLDIQLMISKGLTSISDDGEVVPSLAMSWEINSEGKEYLFNLRQDVFWHDGKKFVAKDINYNFSDVALSIIDNNKILFKLKEPYAPFPSVVSRPIFKKLLLGTGDYKVSKIKRNGQTFEKIVLSPLNPETKKTYTKIILNFYPTEESARIAFKLGEIDYLKDISKPEELSEWKNVNTIPEVKKNRFVAVYFNTQFPKLADKSTRQALTYAINKIWEPRAFNPNNPSSWAYTPAVKSYDFDINNAKKLLEKDGKQEALKEIELATIPSLLEVAEKIKSDWEKLGITTKIKIVNVLQSDFQALLITQEVPLDPDQYTLWHSTQPSNISKYRSPKIDKLLEDGRKTLDLNKRKEIYYDFQRFLVEDSPAIFLFHPTVYTLVRK